MVRIFVGHDRQTPAARGRRLLEIEEGERRELGVWILLVGRLALAAAKLAGRGPLAVLRDLLLVACQWNLRVCCWLGTGRRPPAEVGAEQVAHHLEACSTVAPSQQPVSSNS